MIESSVYWMRDIGTKKIGEGWGWSKHVLWNSQRVMYFAKNWRYWLIYRSWICKQILRKKHMLTLRFLFGSLLKVESNIIKVCSSHIFYLPTLKHLSDNHSHGTLRAIQKWRAGISSCVVIKQVPCGGVESINTWY